MSVERTIEDAAVVPEPEKEVWPRRFLEQTPTLGWTPNLPDEEVVVLVAKARKAAPQAFGSVEAARDADAPAVV